MCLCKTTYNNYLEMSESLVVRVVIKLSCKGACCALSWREARHIENSPLRHQIELTSAVCCVTCSCTARCKRQCFFLSYSIRRSWFQKGFGKLMSVGMLLKLLEMHTQCIPHRAPVIYVDLNSSWPSWTSTMSGSSADRAVVKAALGMGTCGVIVALPGGGAYPNG